MSSELWFAVFLITVAASGMIFSLTRSRRSQRATIARILIAMIAFLCLCAFFYSFTIDDAYISLRYARNIAEGYGPVFSTDGSPPVEAYTNFLWVIMEAALFRLPFISDDNVIHVVKCIGIIFGLCFLVLLALQTRELNGSDTAIAWSVSLAAWIPYIAFWSVGGLETPLYLALAAGALLLLIRAHKRSTLRGGIPAGVVLALLGLTRPEGAVFAFAMWAILAVGSCATATSWRSRLWWVGGVATTVVLYGAYFWWRYQYYGYLAPNSFYAKGGARSADDFVSTVLHRGLDLAGFWQYLLPLVCLAAIGIPARYRQGTRSHSTILLWATLVAVGLGLVARYEWMPGYRYELLIFASLPTLAAIGLSRIRVSGTWQRLVAAAGLAVYLAIPAYTSLTLWRAYGPSLDMAHVSVGKWIHDVAPHNCSLATCDMGALAFFSHCPRMIETGHHGLLDYYITHEGWTAEHILSQEPSLITLGANDATNADSMPRENSQELAEHPSFKGDYVFLFTFRLADNYKLSLYRHRAVHIDGKALRGGHELAVRSFQNGIDWRLPW